MMSKEEKLPMKICLDNSMRTDSGTEVDAPNFGITAGTSYYLELKISEKNWKPSARQICTFFMRNRARNRNITIIPWARVEYEVIK